MPPTKESSIFTKKSFYFFVAGVSAIIITGLVFSYKKLGGSKSSAQSEDGKDTLDLTIKEGSSFFCTHESGADISGLEIKIEEGKASELKLEKEGNPIAKKERNSGGSEKDEAVKVIEQKTSKDSQKEPKVVTKEEFKSRGSRKGEAVTNEGSKSPKFEFIQAEKEDIIDQQPDGQTVKIEEKEHIKRQVKKDDYEAAVKLIKNAKKIMVLTGAGISVAAGIPDFRSKNGFFEQVRKKYPDVNRPEDLLTLKYFDINPEPFYKRCIGILGDIKSPQPTKAHRFIKWLEDRNQLALNVSQNIDTLELKAGIKKFVNAHGSFATSHCRKCNKEFSLDVFTTAVREKPGQVVKCTECDGVVKPDITFYGEQLPANFFSSVKEVAPSVDLVIIMGSSMLVSPFCNVPDNYIDDSVPRILINMDPITKTRYDIFLQGDCQVAVQKIIDAIGN